MGRSRWKAEKASTRGRGGREGLTRRQQGPHSPTKSRSLYPPGPSPNIWPHVPHHAFASCIAHSNSVSTTAVAPQSWSEHLCGFKDCLEFRDYILPTPMVLEAVFSFMKWRCEQTWRHLIRCYYCLDLLKLSCTLFPTQANKTQSLRTTFVTTFLTFFH